MVHGAPSVAVAWKEVHVLDSMRVPFAADPDSLEHATVFELASDIILIVRIGFLIRVGLDAPHKVGSRLVH